MYLNLRGYGYRALIADKLDAGFLLLEDLGSDVLLSALVLKPDTAGKWYEKALNTLAEMVKIGPQFPLYDEDCLQAEIHLFLKWFLEDLLNMDIGLKTDIHTSCKYIDKIVLTNLIQLLVNNALEQYSGCGSPRLPQPKYHDFR